MDGNLSQRSGDLADQPETDKKFVVTIFSSVTEKKPSGVKELTKAELSEQIRTTEASAKNALPLLKLARFGTNKSHAGSLRHDGNVEAISGIEVDYDAGIVPFSDAVCRLRAAKLAFIAYTTPSHTEGQPRWRVLAFCSRPLPGEERSRLVARLNGELGGVVSSESFALSQIYYFGSITGAAGVKIESGEGDFIDLRDDLDAAAIGKGCDPRAAVPVALEAYLKSQVEWANFYDCPDLKSLETSQPSLFSRLQLDLGREGSKLAKRWQGATEDLTDKSRSGIDRSLVQILRQMGYNITEAITSAAAWGGTNPKLGRGWDCSDRSHREIDIERYWVRCWRGKDDLAPVPVEQLPLPPPIKAPAAMNPFPEACRQPAGAVGALADYFSRGMARHVPDELLILMALAAVAHAAQNRFLAGPTKASLQLYVALGANTGVGKTEMAKMLAKLVEGSAAEWGIVEGVASGPALAKRFHKLASTAPYGPTILFLMDELGLKLQSRTSRSGNTHTKDMVDECISLYGRGNSRYAGKAYADTRNDIDPIDHPNLNIVGFTTPTPLIEALKGTDAAAGLVNRFLLATAEGEMPMKLLREVDPTPSADLVHFMKRIGDRNFRPPATGPHAAMRNGVAQIASALPPTLLTFNQEAERSIDDITAELNRKAHNSDDITESIWGRARQQVIVVAAILAVGEIDVTQEELQLKPITVDHVAWAWEFVRWSTQNWVAMFKTKISGSDEEAAMNAIMDLLKRVSDYAPNGRLAQKTQFGTSRYIGQACGMGWMPVSLIGRELRWLRSDLRERALKGLLDNEEIERMDIDRPKGTSGPRTEAYRIP